MVSLSCVSGPEQFEGIPAQYSGDAVQALYDLTYLEVPGLDQYCGGESAVSHRRSLTT